MAAPGFLGFWKFKRTVAMSVAGQGVLKSCLLVLKHAVSDLFKDAWYRHTLKSTADPLLKKILNELPDQNFRLVLEKCARVYVRCCFSVRTD